MTTSIVSKAGGTQGSLQINGVDSIVFDSTGIVSGVNKSAVTQMPTLGTAVATTSGTSIDFTGIPSWVKRITVMFNGVSTTGTSIPQIQLGSGSVQTTGYISGAGYLGNANSTAWSSVTAGFHITSGWGATSEARGMMTLCLISGSTWVANSVTANVPALITQIGGGTVTLAGALDRIRLTTANGTDTFDAGSVNILYE